MVSHQNDEMFPVFAGEIFVNGVFPIGIMLIITSVLHLLVLSTVGTAMTTIYQTALYLYSRDGLVSRGFQPELLQYAFQPKPQSEIAGMFGK